ncbi:hypothetical protein D9611_014230 [Ephemerocybe angulata]|uniref:Aminotransferase class V domain-containing protein n=1 Tax=Ephemerocybe angulata TaxID=980116 RepID=A0A8H5B9I1_9AGAR|nr:hypothetical protein D9611_014230 [Tulosesus angulatus]
MFFSCLPKFKLKRSKPKPANISGQDPKSKQRAAWSSSSPSLVEPEQDEKSTPASQPLGEDWSKFLQQYPEYSLTSKLDDLRKTDFTRLDKSGETYVDYMGGSLYPESIVERHTSFLKEAVLGNTHSINNSSRASSKHADEAREAVLSFFDAPSDVYTVVFTANASGALKLVGESFPFKQGSAYVLSTDSHNSVNGIREFARAKGAHTAYIPATSTGGFELDQAKSTLDKYRSSTSSPCLFALTGQSNISNWKAPLASISQHASSLGYNVLVDAAALAANSTISLSKNPYVDAMAISFYKMFGFPTGVGALVIKKEFLAKLKRPWFAGGTVDFVKAPGEGVIWAEDIHEQFADGTINYLSLPAITYGLQFLSGYLPVLPLRLSCLLHHLTDSLLQLRHPNGNAVVRILSSIPQDRVRSVGQQSDVGSLASLIFLDPLGQILQNSFIEHAASKRNISLRTGCVCNPGAAHAMLGIPTQIEAAFTSLSASGVQPTRTRVEGILGREIGVVRISLGLASNYEDVMKVVRFAEGIADAPTRERWMGEWRRSEDAHV